MLDNFQHIKLPFKKPLNLLVYRLDQNDSLISGNKYYKLRPWVKQALTLNKALVSCGGAFSNHLHALAAAGLKHNIKTYGLVRALEVNNPTMTMQDCMSMGMTLISVTRENYKKRYQDDFLRPYQNQIKHDSLWIAEGGMSDIAITACEDIAININNALKEYQFNAVYIAVGSGGTLAGIARQLEKDITLYAVPVMKNWTDVKQNVERYLTSSQAQRIHWVDNASYGGFGKAKANHIEFIANVENISHIPLDPVYTSKVFRHVIECHVKKNDSSHLPLIIHTGGLQGRRSIMEKLKLVKITSNYFNHLKY